MGNRAARAASAASPTHTMASPRLCASLLKARSHTSNQRDPAVGKVKATTSARTAKQDSIRNIIVMEHRNSKFEPRKAKLEKRNQKHEKQDSKMQKRKAKDESRNAGSKAEARFAFH